MQVERLTILLVTPAPVHSRKGNRITALRWARILRALGHHVRIAEQYRGQRCDLLVALHARHSFASIARFREQHPNLPLIVALTGTDLYGDIHSNPQAQQSLEMASRFVLLQPEGVAELPEHLRERVRAIYQSAEKPRGKWPPRDDIFQVCVLGHLRPVKDPFRAAWAARQLPASSHLEVVQVGAALSPEMEKEARAEEAANPRYRWLGELPRWKALRTLARSRLHVLSSRMEGGANALSEAIAAGVPTLASRIFGSIGILGSDYPGYFPVGDTQALASLLDRAETDSVFLSGLQRWCNRLKPLVEPARERQSWENLLRELSSEPRSGEATGGSPKRFTLIECGADTFSTDLAREVKTGLTGQPKNLPYHYLYDPEGSRLFESICQLPEYYLTRAEKEILGTQRARIVATLPERVVLVELGSGNAAKTRILIEELLRRYGTLRYVPVDISPFMLKESSRALRKDYPGLEIVAIAGEYSQALAHLEAAADSQRKLILWLGSSIGNLEREDAARFLQLVRNRMAETDRLLIGIDLRKDRAILENAYDDSQGVTAEFNRNLLARVNREFGGHFDPSAFQHRAVYNEEAGRVEMYLVSDRSQEVLIEGFDLEVSFGMGEAIHTENSYKYSLPEIATLAATAGFTVQQQWFDADRRFSVNLLAPQPFSI